MNANDTLPRHIAAQPLSHVGFAPFGDVIMPGGQNGTPINERTAQRFDDLTVLDLETEGGSACLTVFRTQGATPGGTIPLRAFERHCLGSQTFVPLGQGRCLAVMTTGEQTPDESTIQAFIVEPGQGITVRRGVWHHPLITLGAADVLVLERKAARPDCELRPLSEPVVVTIPEK
ncbi:ureidoglycolate lyase [Noviherbaspirillum sp. Root189]|uniref:ureidoglycolate lyase n=1 Tax=Noviherbaspirillum sp. Root189 TaxID=1736487 RepID=UPI00070B3863|nr:ureidoglycolate lyase [Noviherbaspirillum sp. Root189]KRB85177.1 ureidoglycolate hydrolase [Noviherbaspirillum sp. Root189]